MDNLKNFVSSVGILCETWLIVYGKFIESGLDISTALVHTKEFMNAFISVVVNNNLGGKNGA